MGRRPLFNFDFGLLIPVFILVGISLVTLFSLNVNFFKTQFVYLIISVIAFLFFSQINLNFFKSYALPIYISSVIILSLTLVIGFQSRGAVRWFDILGFKIQFSEIVKPFLLFSLATFLSKNPPDFKTFLKVICFLIPLAFLIYKQPDLGNVIIFLATTVFILIISGFPFLWFLIGIIMSGVTVPFFWHFLHDYQKQRILSFVYPGSDPLGKSYNAIQSVIAVGSGMFFGKGFNQGTQSSLRFLPEKHTDFIFAAISENLGFIGSLAIILFFAFLLYKIYLMLGNTDDRFNKIFLTSSFCLILVQTFINIGMNIGVLPVVGVTLPFVSSGGSSLLSNFILLGLIYAISKTLKEKGVLEIR